MVWCEGGHRYDEEVNASCPHCGRPNRDVGRQDEERRTETRGPAFRPVVAWLVCIAGGEAGRDYRLCAGDNSLGRDLSSQVCIACDLEVARKNHARVFHDPESAETWLVPGGEQDAVSLNGAVASESVRLRPHDVITLGSTRLMFVPFCGDRFKWNGAPAEAVGPPGRDRMS
jgi:predicted RNA-binding Zn-ribbon protein involved in translation (DUF1610 family)